MDFPRRIYAIQHNATKRIYIGSSKNVNDRYMNHIYRLRSGKHHIEDMQEDFNEYGEDFSLFILDEIKTYAERKKEYEWMRKYNSFKRGIGYNYKDHEKEILCLKNTPPYKNGVPEFFYEKECKQTSKKKYISDIRILLEQCNDLSLLDFILQLLSKV